MARRFKYGLRDALWFWRNLPDSMRLVLNLMAFTVLGVVAALSTADYPLSPFGLRWLGFGLYWLGAWLVWQPIKILVVLVRINRHPATVEQLKRFLAGKVNLPERSDERKHDVR